MAKRTNKAGKPTKVVKPSRNTKRSTPHTRNHRWQSFTERISKLKIDPIRRKRNPQDRDGLSDNTETYFGRSLAEWKDLNLSATFTAFAKDASPLCDSLAMILHNEETVMDLLVAYIEKADELAMEPLLALLAHFAHDLDTRFEKHFARAVSTVAAVASKHPDPAVVEWSFTCLAWLFKYLSRLLTPDLRPLYTLMSPYMGKETQKPFIIRFAAESISFLVRKAAAQYDRDQQPLDQIIEHIMEDCRISEGTRSADLYRQGVMTLLTEAVKGIQHGLHSSGIAVLKSLLNSAVRSPSTTSTEIVVGALTSIIHFTTPETFIPVTDLIIAELGILELQAADDAVILFASEILFTIVSVRKGTRLQESWRGVVASISSLVQAGYEQSKMLTKTRSRILATFAVILQTAPVDAILPALGLLDDIREEQWASHFLRFCDYVSRLGFERFEKFVLSHLQKFVSKQWQQDPDTLLLLLPRLASRGTELQLQAPAKLQSHLVTLIKNASKSHASNCDNASIISADLALGALPFLKMNESTTASLRKRLCELVGAGLNLQEKDQAHFRCFALGPALSASVVCGASFAGEWSALCAASKDFAGSPAFWTGIAKIMKHEDSLDFDGSHIQQLSDAALLALPLPSHQIRRSALGVLESIYKHIGKPVPEVLSIATLIESTPINLETSRGISMNIRRLAAAYENQSGLDDVMLKAIPTYCFGLLHVRLAQVWDDALTAISSMSKSPIGEETIVALAQSWLGGQPEASSGETVEQVLTVESEGFGVASDFECSNLAKISAISNQVFEEAHCGYQSPEQCLHADLQSTSVLTGTTRSQALRVLDRIPQVAEKRSRLLVPVLLRWTGSLSEDDQVPESARWSRKDQKAMLGVFAKFNNPRVLFKSAEVYDALLSLCANGDVEIQKSALKAVLAWKEPALVRYQEHLNNFLDDARFREEVSVFLSGEDEESLRPTDHATIMPVMLRLLYGRAVGGAKDTQHVRRKAIFVALSRFENDVLESFISIALAGTAKLQDNSTVPLRQQVGMLNMLDDMLDTLGSTLEPFAGQLADAVLVCSVAASKRLDVTTTEETQDASLLRSIRQTGLQCLVKIFAEMQDSDLVGQGKTTVLELVSPRLEAFAAENNQSISATLRLFAAFSNCSAHAQHLFAHDDQLLARVADLLKMTAAQNEVKVFILRDILDKLLLNDDVRTLLQPYVSGFVASISHILGQQPASDVLSACVASTTRLAERITDPQQAGEIIQVCAHLLRQPGHFVHPSVKAGLVRTMMPLLDSIGDDAVPPGVYEAMAGLFSRLRDLDSRTLFSNALVKLCRNDAELAESADICVEINALDSGRLNEPNHERKEQGFVRIYEGSERFTPAQWLPLMHNCLLFIRDEDDTVNRSSAARALELFIVASSKSGNMDLIKSDLFPAVQRGMKERSELVRAEYLRLLGQLVQHFPEWSEVNDMNGLTVEGDDEASFFSNVLHIQQHRRLRALRRLAEEPKLRSQNVNRIFLPLLEQFIFDAVEGDTGRTLADQAVLSIGALAKNLKWSDFRTVMKRYLAELKKNPEQEKVVLRLIGALVDGLTSKMNELKDVTAKPEEPEASHTGRQKVIMTEFLPPLSAYLHHKDESTVDRRVGVAVSIVKLLLLLPETDFVAGLAPTLTDIAHILKSRDLEAREQTRRTFSTILSLVGPMYLHFMLGQLRSALQRGYQLHVLSFTVHHLLVTNAAILRPGDLDTSLHELMAIVMDDIFGVTGQEKDAEEYKSGMKEIKSSKSYDTLEIVARMTSIPKLGQLILPIRAMLQERLDMKRVSKIDDLLVRIRKGIDQNPAADSRDMLVFCHEVVRQVYAQEAMPAVRNAIKDYKVQQYLIASEQKAIRKGATTSYLFKLSSFALNLVRKVIRRHDDLQTPANMAGYLPVCGDAMVGGQEEVKIAAVKLLTTIIRVPLKDIDTNSPVYLKEAVNMIKASPSSTTDSAKAALDLVTAILREKRSVDVKERDIAYLLKTLKQDLDEPDRQGILFRFLRAVLGRKIVITEVYEVMDEVAKMMITNPDESVRQSARSAYLQFVLDYPQGKDRWTKQTGFLIKNLDYQHVAGRRSVMEVLHGLLGKLGDETVQPLLVTLFVGLVPRLSGDVDNACRDMARLLIGKVFERADEEKEKGLTEMLKKWMDAEKKLSLRRAALLCWTIFVKAGKAAAKQVDLLLGELEDITGIEVDTEAAGEVQFMLTSLQLLVAICESTPEQAFSTKRSALWSNVQQRLAIDAVEVQQAAATLQDMLFNDAASTTSKSKGGLSTLPMRASGGLELGAPELRTACALNMRVLRNSSIDATSVVAQTVRNVAFLGRIFAANNMQWKSQSIDDDNEDDIEEDEDKTQEKDTTAIGYLLSRLSFIIRRENAPVSTRTAALQCQTALLTQLTPPYPHITTLIRPLYSLTDASIPQPPGEAYAALSNLARETLDLLQKKLGSEVYVTEMAKARKFAMERRDERRRKRRIEAVSEPEKYAKDRKRKYEGKKLKQKERGMEARGKRRGW